MLGLPGDTVAAPSATVDIQKSESDVLVAGTAATQAAGT